MFFSGNKTRDHRLGACPKTHVFASFFSCFFLYKLFMQKNEKEYFNYHLECAAPKPWPKYTTCKLNEMGLGITKLWLCQGCQPKQTTTRWKIMPYCFRCLPMADFPASDVTVGSVSHLWRLHHQRELCCLRCPLCPGTEQEQTEGNNYNYWISNCFRGCSQIKWCKKGRG